MAKVRVVRTVKVGGRAVAVKRVPNLAPILARKTRTGPEMARSMVEATTVQIRILAQEARELIIDKLFAAAPQAPAQATVSRPQQEAPGRLAGDRRPYRHVRLTDKHVQKKARDGEDGRKLIATGDYVAGIEVFRGEQASGVYYIVRPEAREHVPSGMTLSLLARVHEYGSARHKIPPRPHWGPAIRAVIAAMPARVARVRAEALRRTLRRIV